MGRWVGGGWLVCKPTLVIGFARAKPQADQYSQNLISELTLGGWWLAGLFETGTVQF